jgi:hypothetical protein
MFGVKEDDKEKKPLIKRIWKRIVGGLAVLGVLWGIFEGVYIFAEYVHEYENLKEKVDSEAFDVRITKLEKYVLNKRKSFHVGFRVFKYFDEETGLTTRVKRYRDWNGVWHEIFRDLEASETYKVDYYYYIDKKTDEKIYCW